MPVLAIISAAIELAEAIVGHIPEPDLEIRRSKVSAGDRVGIEVLQTKVVSFAIRLLRYHGAKLLKSPSTEQHDMGRRATSTENAYFELRAALGELLLSNYTGEKGHMLDALDEIGMISDTLIEQQ